MLKIQKNEKQQKAIRNFFNINEMQNNAHLIEGKRRQGEGEREQIRMLEES